MIPTHRGAWRFALGLLVVAHVALALYPFHFDPPRLVSNDVTRVAGGGLLFGEHNRARTPSTPQWLSRATHAGAAEVTLSLRTWRPSQQGPARILTLARGADEANLTVAQDGADLVVRVRRHESLPDGRPPLVFRHELAHAKWTDVRITIAGRTVTVVADQEERQHVAEAPVTSTWDLDVRLALGSEPAGGKPWRGQIGSASVVIAGDRIDLLDSRRLETPSRYLYLPQREWQEVAPRPLAVLAVDAAHLVSFVPVGAAAVLSQRRRSLPRALALALCLAIALTLLKWLVELRHPSVVDVAVQTIGGVLGAAAIAVAMRRGLSGNGLLRPRQRARGGGGRHGSSRRAPW